MTFEEFDKFSEELVAECFKMRTTKGKEYAHSSVDRFANFKRIAEKMEVKPSLVAMIYCQKHIDSIQSYIVSGKIHSTERIRGRCVDVITYMMLIAGLLEEEESQIKTLIEDNIDEEKAKMKLLCGNCYRDNCICTMPS